MEKIKRKISKLEEIGRTPQMLAMMAKGGKNAAADAITDNVQVENPLSIIFRMQSATGAESKVCLWSWSFTDLTLKPG